MTTRAEMRERREQVVAGAIAGQSALRLAKQHDVSVQAVYNILWAARRAGINVPAARTGSESGGTRVLLPADLVAKLAVEAQARGLEPRELALQLLHACIDSGIVAAVLDDEEDYRG